ncbi:alpha-galactosidase/alpha-n-acetylgalactosaminidase [Fomitiporia mediterranea MF3/22]|uniref:alpha-galactosidase/alpha-n- acetylgalactosaminidase n=1 Tax=Fomitiporia mediterranea (strain MF3/22) TaxID=694068 RepID=UPI00044082C6|nr:alpha-galactosidase/alpha-n-acetylgalactosaminidase [Fomitiporia mediterranea MF3/22]EJC99288.1 alpha-galactosidase/alpha-n-acetylgalactosaminidase [Fomitiporia mediterranea MF3/22]
MMQVAGLAVALAVLCSLTRATDNGLAVTPQMGWNTWNAFGCSTSEDLLLSTGKLIAGLGLRDLGYKYVVQDDCWSAGRNSTGHLQVDTTKFPNGLSTVADELHGLGLGFGIYSDAGALTCGRFAGSLGHETQDAETWASWGVDYLKYDNCYNEGQSGTPQISYTRYKTMADALNATGRHILYSMCNWGEDRPWNWAQTVANSWRMSGDIYDNFDRPDQACPCPGEQGIDCALPGFKCSMMNILNKVASFPDKGVTGAWNDMDMLEIGNGGMTDDEYKTHFTMWAALKSPLIMGNDLRKITPETLSILSNPAVLAISQDTGSRPAFRRWRYFVGDTDKFGQGEIQMWSGSLSGGDALVVLLNGGDKEREMNATLVDIFWDNMPLGNPPQASQAWDVYDLWGNRMDNDTAARIIAAANQTALGNATSDPSTIGSEFRYNATQMGGYTAGLQQNSTVLLGEKVGTVEPHGSVTATVPRHGVGAFRLRAQASEKTAQHQEL